MIKELDNIFKKTNIYEANYVYIYSDFRHFFKYCKNDPKKNTKLFLELFTKKKYHMYNSSIFLYYFR